MISGECPYEDCDGRIWLPMPSPGGVWGKHTCEECGRVYWEYYSRWQSYAMTEENFLAEYAVNEETKQLTRIGAAA